MIEVSLEIAAAGPVLLLPEQCRLRMKNHLAGLVEQVVDLDLALHLAAGVSLKRWRACLLQLAQVLP